MRQTMATYELGGHLYWEPVSSTDPVAAAREIAAMRGDDVADVHVVSVTR